MRVANTSGFSPTDAGTPLPPVTPARMRWNMSAAYTREHDGHTDARRFPHRVSVVPSGSESEEYVDSTSPVAASTVVEEPTRWTGRAQNPTRDAAADQSSNRSESSRLVTCRATSPWVRARSRPASSPNPANDPGAPSRVSRVVVGVGMGQASSVTGWRGVRGFRGDRGRGVTGPVSTGSSAGTVIGSGRGERGAGGDRSGEGGDVVVGEVRGADPADGAGAFDADVGDAGGGLADVVGAGAGVAGAVAEDHVDLEGVVQAQGDAGGEQVAPADDVLAGVLHRGEDGDPDRAALGQQQPEGLVDPPGRGPVGERGQGGELVDDHEHVRRPRTSDVLADPLGGECLGAGVHDGDEVLQQVAHRLGGGVLEPGEQSPAGPQLHPALGVDRPHLHPPRRDGRGEAVEEGPDHRALPGPGRAGDEHVGAEQAEPPQGPVLAPAHRHARDRRTVSSAGRGRMVLARASRRWSSTTAHPGVAGTRRASRAPKPCAIPSRRWATSSGVSPTGSRSHSRSMPAGVTVSFRSDGVARSGASAAVVGVGDEAGAGGDDRPVQPVDRHPPRHRHPRAHVRPVRARPDEPPHHQGHDQAEQRGEGDRVPGPGVEHHPADDEHGEDRGAEEEPHHPPREPRPASRRCGGRARR